MVQRAHSSHRRARRQVGMRSARVRVALSCTTACAMFAFSLAAGAGTRTPAQRPALRFDGPASVAVGRVASLRLVGESPGVIGAFQASLRYDHTALEVIRVRSPRTLAGAGALTPLSAVETPNRTVVAGWTCSGPGCLSAPATAGAPALLATIEIEALRPGRIDLRIDGGMLVAPNGASLGRTSTRVLLNAGSGGDVVAAPLPSVSVAGPAAALAGRATSDVNGDGHVTPLDVAALTAAWVRGAERDMSCPPPPPGADLNGDGCMSIADLQAVAGAIARAPARPSKQAVHAAATTSFTVNSNADGADKTADGVCQTNTSGQCTLRAALTEANRASGPVSIAFSIAGTGIHTIVPATQLPSLNNPSGITIDGFTQPGSSPNTDDLADNAVYGIELKGTGGTGVDGLVVAQANNVIRGLNMHAFDRAIWIYGTDATNNLVEGNMLGLTPTGAYDPTYALVGSATCVVMQHGAAYNQIGAPGNANRNVVSGCDHQDIATYDWPTKYNTIQNNITGLDPTGTQRRAAQSHGIDINTGTQYTMIGGTNPGERNVSSGNLQEGVEISHNPLTLHNSIVGNYIGTDLTGNAASAVTQNGQWGVHLEGDPTCNNAPCGLDAGFNTVTGNVIVNSRRGGLLVDKGVHDSVIASNKIGVTANGTAAGNLLFGVNIQAGSVRNVLGPGNEIAYNANGVQLESDGVEPPNSAPSVTNRNTITQNSIRDNGSNGVSALGIDLAPFGAVNNAGNADPNTNDAMLAPTLSQATETGIVAATCAGCTVELFVADQAAGSIGSGTTYVESATAGASGVVTLALAASVKGKVVTASATNTIGSTSEFARNVQIPGTTGGAPGAPAIDNAATMAGNGWAIVGWTPPASQGGSAISSYTAAASPGNATVTVGFLGRRAVFKGLSNGTHYTFTVKATNASATGAPSAASPVTTPSAGTRSYTTAYNASDNTRLLRNAAYFGTGAAEAQLDSVGIIAYITGIVASPTLSPVAPPASSGPHSYATAWSDADQGALVAVMRQYALTPSETQYFSVQLIGFLLALGGH